MFRRSQQPQFEAFRSKTHLKCAIAAIKQAKGRKSNQAKNQSKEVGQLLADQRGELARIKVEHVIRTKNETCALEMLELFCDLLLARHMLLESEVELPVELQEAVFSICWASTRTEITDLRHVKMQFMLKWPVIRQQFDAASRLEGAEVPEQSRYVNEALLRYLTTATPPRKRVQDYLVEIGAIFGERARLPLHPASV
eukprot:COSAG01_NODE_2161_length_8268_cov_23.645122_8_plen_198_part_00